MIGAARLATTSIVLAGALTISVGPAASQTTSDGPGVTVDRDELRPGDRIVLTIDGFSASAVTVSVCGNEARRGSSDCNMPESEGIRLNGDDSPTVSRVPVAVPPEPCPCVVRVSSRNQVEVALAPITLIGHPVGPLVGSPTLDDPLAVSITAEPASRSALDRLRGSLGGPVAYDVTVRVANRSTETLRHVGVTGSVGRDGDDDVATFEIPDPGRLDPGQSWEHIARAELPAPVIGGVTWHVAVSGAGQTAAADHVTSHLPGALIVLAVVFVADMCTLAWRYVVRRRRRAESAGTEPGAAVSVVRTAAASR